MCMYVHQKTLKNAHKIVNTTGNNTNAHQHWINIVVLSYNGILYYKSKENESATSTDNILNECHKHKVEQKMPDSK